MRFFFILFFIFYSSFFSFALKKESQVILEHYENPTVGSIGMFGHVFNTYLSPSLYYSLSVFEAIYGRDRAGYAVANFGFGQKQVFHTYSTDIAFYIGAGGGGHLRQYVAGGLSLKAQAGLIYTPFRPLIPVIYIGAITYPYGNLSAFFLSTGIQYSFDIQTHPLDEEDPNYATSWDMVFKHYLYNRAQDEYISLLGGERKKYLPSGYYYGESGFAAISNGRFGYIEVGFLIGKQYYFGPMILDGFFGLGAGGGGGSDRNEGSGFLVQYGVQLGSKIAGPFDINLDFRNVNFISGAINSLSTGVTLRYNFGQY